MISLEKGSRRTVASMFDPATPSDVDGEHRFARASPSNRLP